MEGARENGESQQPHVMWRFYVKLPLPDELSTSVTASFCVYFLGVYAHTALVSLSLLAFPSDAPVLLRGP